MPDRPLFSVVLPTYGRPGFLAEAIESVLAQTIPDFECIVVDDASPEPVEVPADPRVRLVRRDTNGGVSAARNTGLREARGRYVVFLDDDDVLTPDRVATGLEGLARAPIALCWLRPLGRRLTRRQRRQFRRNENRVLMGDVRDVVLDRGRLHLGQVAMERGIAPSFDERFRNLGDVEWWVRASRAGLFVTVPRVGYLQRAHDDPRVTDRLSRRIEANLLLLEVHAGYFASHPRALAKRWRGIGGVAERLGDRKLARSAYGRSLRLDPRPGTLWRVIRSLGPSTHRSEPADRPQST